MSLKVERAASPESEVDNVSCEYIPRGANRLDPPQVAAKPITSLPLPLSR